MNYQTLQTRVESILATQKREGETWLMLFDRLNLEGRIDMRALTYCISDILDYLASQAETARLWDETAAVNKEPTPVKKDETKPKPKKK